MPSKQAYALRGCGCDLRTHSGTKKSTPALFVRRTLRNARTRAVSPAHSPTRALVQPDVCTNTAMEAKDRIMRERQQRTSKFPRDVRVFTKVLCVCACVHRGVTRARGRECVQVRFPVYPRFSPLTCTLLRSVLAASVCWCLSPLTPPAPSPVPPSFDLPQAQKLRDSLRDGMHSLPELR